MFSGPYFQLEFPKSFLFLSGYSMKGIIRSGENTCYQKSWRIEGFNKGEESDTSKWKLIGRNSSSEDNFCGSTQWCTSSDIATYKLTQQTTGFNFIRWTAESTYCISISNTRFVTAGIEVYGKLTTASGNKKIVCTCFLYRAPLISPAICTILFSL